ncbi:MAG: hypothetical protein ACRDFB_08270 [Rhabdochlamydiaceae bacterium]
MQMEDFFDFGSKLVSSTVQAHAAGLKTGENDIDDHWNLVKGNYKGIHFPITFKQAYGKKLTDILDTGWPCLYLISDRMKSILEENGLSGWQTFSIKLYDKKENEISGYQGFSLTGCCGPTVYKKSTIFEKKLVPTGPVCKFYKGIFIDSWDGSDFFTPKGTYHTLITKKAADILKKSKLTNVRLENLADREIDVHLVKKDA